MKLLEKNFIKSNLLDWKPGKIVGFSSKKLSTLTNSDFKLVKIKPFAMYPVHVHPNKTESLFIIEGELAVNINGNKYQGTLHDFFIFPSGIEHNIINNTNKDCIAFIGSIKN